MRRLSTVLLTGLLTGCATAQPLPGQGASGSLPRTHAERSGWGALTPHTEVLSFYQDLAMRAPDVVRIREIGRSREGRPLNLVTLSRPGVAEPWEAHASGKPIVLIGAQVHGDEPAGKEGLMLFARDLVDGDLSHLLDRVVFVFVPQMNPDGAEAGTWGTRANPAGYNLNRDYLRLDNPETRAVAREAIVRWRPHVVVDAHELPGPPRVYDFYTWYPDNPHGPSAPVRLAREGIAPAVVDALESAGYTHIVYHTPGGVAQNPSEGIAVPVYGRTMNDYAAAHGLTTILFESLRERDARVGIQDRAKRHRIAMEALARYVAEHPEEVVEAAEEGRKEMQRRGARWSEADSIAVRRTGVASREIDYRVGEMRRVDGRWESTGEILELRVPLVDSAVVTLGRVRPVGYVLEPHRGDLAEHLAGHGVQVERMLAPAEVRVESFRVDSVRTSESPYEGYVPQEVRTTLQPRTLSLPAGAYLVRADQPAAALVFHLLEPEDENSYASGGEFAAEARAGSILPVHRVVEVPRVPAALLP